MSEKLYNKLLRALYSASSKAEAEFKNKKVSVLLLLCAGAGTEEALNGGQTVSQRLSHLSQQCSSNYYGGWGNSQPGCNEEPPAVVWTSRVTSSDAPHSKL